MKRKKILRHGSSIANVKEVCNAQVYSEGIWSEVLIWGIRGPAAE